MVLDIRWHLAHWWNSKKKTKARTVATYPIFADILTGYDPPSPTRSFWVTSSGRAFIGAWWQCDGLKIQGLGIGSNTICKLMHCTISSDLHLDAGLQSLIPGILHMTPSHLTPFLFLFPHSSNIFSLLFPRIWKDMPLTCCLIQGMSLMLVECNSLLSFLPQMLQENFILRSLWKAVYVSSYSFVMPIDLEYAHFKNYSETILRNNSLEWFPSKI